MMKPFQLIILLLLTLGSTSFAATPVAQSGDQTADTMQILKEKVQADRKLLVASNMHLTNSEADKFWPVYESYLKELKQNDEALKTAILSYATADNANALTDEQATSLMNSYFKIEKSELEIRQHYAKSLAKILPGKKAARAVQIETKIRALVKYTLAGQIPLIQ